jgi:hypothetical protein
MKKKPKYHLTVNTIGALLCGRDLASVRYCDHVVLDSFDGVIDIARPSLTGDIFDRLLKGDAQWCRTCTKAFAAGLR